MDPIDIQYELRKRNILQSQIAEEAGVSAVSISKVIRGKLGSARLMEIISRVSIHAPARGATAKKQSFEVVAYFKRNPRTVGKIRRFRLPSLL